MTEPMAAAGQVDLLERDLSRLLTLASSAETKVNTIFAIDTGMLGILVAYAPVHAAWSPLGLVLSIVAGLSLGVSLLLLSLAAFPHTDGPVDSLIYFGSISRLPFDEFHRRRLDYSEAEYSADLAEQYHRISVITAGKFAWVRRSMLALYLGLPFWLASVYAICQDGS